MFAFLDSLLLLLGCTVQYNYTPRPVVVRQYPQYRRWVAGHYNPRGVWVSGHWT